MPHHGILGQPHEHSPIHDGEVRAAPPRGREADAPPADSLPDDLARFLDAGPPPSPFGLEAFPGGLEAFVPSPAEPSAAAPEPDDAPPAPDLPAPPPSPLASLPAASLSAGAPQPPAPAETPAGGPSVMDDPLMRRYAAMWDAGRGPPPIPEREYPDLLPAPEPPPYPDFAPGGAPPAAPFAPEGVASAAGRQAAPPDAGGFEPPAPPDYPDLGGSGLGSAVPRADFMAQQAPSGPGGFAGWDAPPSPYSNTDFAGAAYATAPFGGVDYDPSTIGGPGMMDSLIDALGGGQQGGGPGGLFGMLLEVMQALRDHLAGTRREGAPVMREPADGGPAFMPPMGGGPSLEEGEGYSVASPSVNVSSLAGLRGAGGWGYGSRARGGESPADFFEPGRRDPR